MGFLVCILARKPLGSQQTSSATHPSTSSCKFPSAISRYLVSNWCVATAWLYAPMFPSAISRYLVSNGREPDKEAQQRFRFHPLYRGTWYLTSVHCVQGHSFLPKFPSAISRYLVSDMPGRTPRTAPTTKFPSAISRYLVSDRERRQTCLKRARVSIRYSAVLGI